MKIDTSAFRIAEGTKVDLAKRATRVPALHRNEEDGHALLARQRGKLRDLQELLYAEHRNALLLVLQGIDSAGKDGIIEHVITGMNPQGVQVTSFKHPSDEEQEHDFLWRSYGVLPRRGHVAVFNRSYYEEVLVTRVHPELLAAQGVDRPGKHFWRDRLRSIVDLERHLGGNGTEVVKVYLHISRDEQRTRLLARIDDPAKNWKFRRADVTERAFWKEYRHAYEAALAATSTDRAPWYVVPADDKRTARLIVSEILRQHLSALQLALPRPSAAERTALRQMRNLLKE